MDTSLIVKKKPRGAAPGERRGGRRPGSISRTTWDLLQKSEQMGSDPLEALLTVIGSDAIRVPQIDPRTGKQAIDEWGECLYTWIAISTAERILACKTVLGFLFPKLASQTVTGANNGPVQVATLNITQILADPEMAKAAQRLALQITEQQNDQVPQLPRPYDHGPK